MRKKPLVRQLFFSYVWVTVAAVLLAGLYGSRSVGNFYLDQTAKDLEARARLCEPEIMTLLDRGDTDEVDAVCKRLGKATSTRITVILPTGKVVGDTEENPARMDNHGMRPEVVQARRGEVGRQTRFSMTLQKNLMYVAVPVYAEGRESRVESREKDGNARSAGSVPPDAASGLDGDPQPSTFNPPLSTLHPQPSTLAVVVRTSIPVTAIDETLSMLHQRIIVAALVTAVLVVGISFWLSSRLNVPLRDLTAGAERFALGQLDHRLPDSSLEEIAVLADAMNRMAGELNERFQTIVRQQNELETVLTSMQEGVLAVDNHSTVINANDACARLLCANSGTLKGRIVHEVIRKPDLLEFVEASISSDASMERDIQIRGTEDRWLHAHSMALCDAEHRKIGTLVVLHDVTRLRRLENVRRDFVANVSHELRTPITSIKGFVETLLDGALGDAENASRFLGIVARQVNRLDAIISDLLILSRVERGGGEPISRLEVGSLCEPLKAAVEMCEKKAGDKQIEIRLECDPATVAKINAPLLEQAVVNLVDNAVKYSEPGKAVRVSARRRDEEVLISVEDEGCGIEPKHLPRLFERFYRVDKARSRELGGTGLGLAIVKHIALAHGGEVDVDSTIGKGTTFTIRLPATSLEVSHAAEPG